MKYLIIFIVLGFFFQNNPFGKDIGRKVNKVVAFQTKRISKIIEKEGACSSLQGHLVNTCRGLKKGFSSVELEQEYGFDNDTILDYIKNKLVR